MSSCHTNEISNNDRLMVKSDIIYDTSYISAHDKCFAIVRAYNNVMSSVNNWGNQNGINQICNGFL